MKSSEPVFIDSDERTHFDAYHFPRTLIDDKRVESSLLDHVNRCIVLQEEHLAPPHASVISVSRDDGMSWAAEQISDAVRHKRWRVLGFNARRSEDNLPEIVSFVGVQAYHRSLTRAGLAPKALWRNVLLILFLISVGVGTILLRDIPGKDWRIVTGLVLLGVLSSVTIRYYDSKKKAEKCSSFEGMVKRDDNTSQVDSALTYLSSKFLARIVHHCVVVDDFSQLDVVTQCVLMKCLLAQQDKHGCLLWYLLEEKETRQIARRIHMDPTQRFAGQFCGGDYDMLVLRRTNLQEKKAIVQRRFLRFTDTDLDGLNLKEIVRGRSSKDGDRLEYLVREYLEDDRWVGRFSPLDVLRLLLLNGSKGFELDYEQVYDLLVRKDSIVAGFSKHYGCMFDNRKEQVELLLHHLNRRLADFFAEKPGEKRKYRIRSGANAAFCGDMDFKMPDLAFHTVLLIYWFNRRERIGNDSKWIQKIAYHAKMIGAEADSLVRVEGMLDISRLAIEISKAAMDATYMGMFADSRCLIAFLNSVLPFLLSQPNIPESKKAYEEIILLNFGYYSVMPDSDLLKQLLNCVNKYWEQLQIEPNPTVETKYFSPFLRIIGFESEHRRRSAKRLFSLIQNSQDLTLRLLTYAELEVERFISCCQKVFAQEDLAWANLPSHSELVAHILRRYESDLLPLLINPSIKYSVLDGMLVKGIMRLLVAYGSYSQVKDLAIGFSVGVLYRKVPESDAATELTLLHEVVRTDVVANSALYVLEKGIRICNGINQFEIPGPGRLPLFRSDLSLGELAKDYWDIIAVIPEYENEVAEMRDMSQVSSDEFRRLQYLLSQCALEWDELALEDMANDSLVSRAKISFDYSNIRFEEALEDLLTTMSRPLKALGYRGIITNLMVASYLNPELPMAAPYLEECLCTSLRFEDGLLRGLFMRLFDRTAIHFSQNGRFVETIQRHLGMQRDLGSPPVTPATVRMLRVLLNAATQNMDERVFCETSDLALQLGELAPLDVRSDIMTHLDAFKLTLDVGRGLPVNWREVLAEWRQKRGGHWLYASILESALNQKAVATPEVIDEARRVLTESLSKGDLSTSLFQLFSSFAEKCADPSKQDLCINLFEDFVVPQLRSFGDPITACDVYDEMLERYPCLSAKYEDEHTEWLALQLQHERAMKLDGAIRQGEYFSVLHNYFVALKRFRLPIQIKDPQFLEDMANDKEYEKKLFGGAVEEDRLHVMVVKDDQRSIVLDFFLLGRRAFDPTHDECSLIRDWRASINITSRENLRAFFWLIGQCDAVPHAIRRVINEHRAYVQSVQTQ